MFSVIITDYKTIRLTIEYIDRFIEYCSDEVDFIVVDNSTLNLGLQYLDDNNVEYIEVKLVREKTYKFELKNRTVILVESEVNGGYAKGNNLGVKVADKAFGNTNLIFSNNDIYFKGKLDLSIFEKKFIDNSHIGIIGTDIIMRDGRKQNPRKDMSFTSQMILQNFNKQWFGGRFNDKLWNRDNDNSTIKVTGWVSGSFMIVNGNAFKNVQGFDEGTFLYAEEMILSERMRIKGYQTLYYPMVTIIHLHRGGEHSNFKIRRMNHISCLYYYKKYKGIGLWRCILSKISFYIAEGVYFVLHKVNNFVKKTEKV